MYGESFMRKFFSVVLTAVVFLTQSVGAAPKTRTSVVNMGTKVAAATANTLVDNECQESYFGCMDAFCIVENVSGGRCLCSNKHIALSDKMKEIMDMDNQSYAITTYGVEHIELGRAADDVLSMSERAFDKAIKDANDESLTDKPKSEKQSGLSFAEWNKSFSDDDDDEDEVFELDGDDIASKKGDELYKAAMTMCFEQTPQKCKENGDMLKMLYANKIKSDCAAFENSLKKQESESTVKLEDAKRNVRDAALTELQNTNKYSLGECALEFKKCMQGDQVCGQDWTGCVKLAAAENMAYNKSGGIAQQVTVSGTFSDITIAATSMDTLLAKKPLCDYITNQCVREKDKVWDVFVKDIVTTIKSAELTAESDLRTNCLSNISQCYIKACKDNMDPKDPDGSYDMCLSRPDNYKSFCKVELEPCLAATGGTYDNPDTSSLWRGILAKLSSMRVDACTNEFKQCLQDEDRCGKDYSKCIGLDSDDIAGICPEDKLTACYKEYGGKTETVRATLERIAQGILLNVDNELLTACENAVTDAMLKVCGDTENCNGLIDEGVGSRSLKLQWCEFDGKNYYNCKDNVEQITDVELGKTTRDADLNKEQHNKHVFMDKMEGIILWDFIAIQPDMNGISSVDEYNKETKGMVSMDEEHAKKVDTEIGSLSMAIKNAISAIESDPRVQYCMTGRQVAGLTDSDGFTKFIGKANNARFPNITKNYRLIISNSALHQARENYYKKYDKMYEEYVVDNFKLAERIAKIQGENQMRNREDTARKSCIALGEDAKFGVGSGGGDEKAKTKLKRTHGNDGKLVGYSSESSYTYKRQVTTTFGMDNLVCHKCIRTQKCKKIGGSRNDHCKKWDDEVEECSDVQF